jgi:ribosome-interacting GTPase 1
LTPTFAASGILAGMDAERLEQLERQRLRALVAVDLPEIDRLHSDLYELITPAGRPVSKQAYVEDVQASDFAYDVFEPVSPVRVHLDGSMGVVRYTARIVVSDGTSVTDAGHFWHTDVWRREGHDWRAVWSQATRIREPEPQG